MAQGDLIISAADANRQFSRILRVAREGGRVTITSHGEPVAELGPVNVDAEAKRRLAARRLLMTQLDQADAVTVAPWTRDGLYDRD